MKEAYLRYQRVEEEKKKNLKMKPLIKVEGSNTVGDINDITTEELIKVDLQTVGNEVEESKKKETGDNITTRVMEIPEETSTGNENLEDFGIDSDNNDNEDDDEDVVIISSHPEKENMSNTNDSLGRKINKDNVLPSDVNSILIENKGTVLVKSKAMIQDAVDDKNTPSIGCLPSLPSIIEVDKIYLRFKNCIRSMVYVYFVHNTDCIS